LRLRNRDYSKVGRYYITICVDKRKRILWQRRNNTPFEAPVGIKLSAIGEVIKTAICQIPDHYATVKVDRFVIMADHIHLILNIVQFDRFSKEGPAVSVIINQLKGYVTKQVGFSIWQKSFNERVIRNTLEYDRIVHYIESNPGFHN